MSTKKKAVSSVALLFFRKTWNSLINIFILGYAAKELDKSAFGVVSISQNLLEFVTALGVGGIGEYFIYFKSKNNQGIRGDQVATSDVEDDLETVEELETIVDQVVKPKKKGIVYSIQDWLSEYLRILFFIPRKTNIKFDAETVSVLNACFWLNTVISLGISLVVFALLPVWMYLFDDPRIPMIVSILVAVTFFDLAGGLAKAGLRKELDYKVLVQIQTLFSTLTSIGKVVMIYYGYGVYSLVVPTAIFTLFQTISLHINSGHRISFGKWEFHRWKTIFGYTKFVAGNNFLNLLINKGDTFVIGKMLGLEAAGVYNIGSQLANLYTKNVQPLMMDVSLPLLAKVSKSTEALQAAYKRMIYVLSVVSYPILLLIICFADPIIHFWFGPKWSDAVIPSQIIAVYGLIRCISSPSSALFMVTGKPNLLFKTNLFLSPLVFGSFFAGAYFGWEYGFAKGGKSMAIYYGTIGVSLAFTLSRAMMGIFNLKQSLKLINLTLGHVWREQRRIIMASLIPVFFAISLFVFQAPLHNFYVFVGSGIITGILFIYSFRFLLPDQILYFVDLISSKSKPLAKYLHQILLINRQNT